jgi:DNA-3-methyladenine glycosylase
VFVDSAAALAKEPSPIAFASAKPTELAITMADNGIDVFDPDSPVTVQLAGSADSAPHAVAGPRVGVSQAADRAWRFWGPGRLEVSAYRRSPRASRPGGSD